MDLPTWSRSFYKACSKKFGLNLWVLIPFQRYENTSRYNTGCSPSVELPPGESPQILPIYFFYKWKFSCKKNYLFRCPQYLATSKYVSTFSTFFQTQDIKIFWALNLESLISRTGSFVTLDRICCYSELEKQICPRDQDGVLKISRLLHLSFTWNKG